MNNERLAQQISFILEIDKLKSILRRSYLIHDTRRENSAEHTWHLTVMALLLAEHANEAVDILRVLKMLIVHDIVEIDADDTYCYDDVAAQTKTEREAKAAHRIFGLLPADQRAELHALWNEFEARVTPEAKFAFALDRLMPILHNYHNEGKSWREHGVTGDVVASRNAPIGEGSATLWDLVQSLLADAGAREFFATVDVAAEEPQGA